MKRYDEVLKRKITQIATLKAAIETYNDIYHNKYLTERSNHLMSVSTHNQYHHNPPITEWVRDPDYSLPEFRCGGKCGQTFNSPLGDHGEICGSDRRKNDGFGSYVDETVAVGCFNTWYSCDPAQVKRHSPIDCTLDHKVYRVVDDEDKELMWTRTCGVNFRRCKHPYRGYHAEIHYFYRRNGRLYRVQWSSGGDKVRSEVFKAHKHTKKMVVMTVVVTTIKPL